MLIRPTAIGNPDKDIFDRKKDAYDAKFPDIARQLIEFTYGDGLEVALGGGRQKFMPKGMADPQISGQQGERLDGRDLTKEWVNKQPRLGICLGQEAACGGGSEKTKTSARLIRYNSP